MNERADSQEDTTEDSGQDNLNQIPGESDNPSGRRRRIRDGLGNNNQETPEHPRRWRDRFKH